MANAFLPVAGKTVNINVSSSSQEVRLGNPDSIRIMNNGTATVWVDFGINSATATTTASMPVGPGVTEVVRYQSNGGPLYVAAIAAGATGIIYFTPGNGI